MIRLILRYLLDYHTTEGDLHWQAYVAHRNRAERIRRRLERR